MDLVWTQDGKHFDSTIHVKGCAHTRLRSPVGSLEATTVEDAKAEIADAMGWGDYPEDANGTGFVLRVAPCVTGRP